MKNICDGICKVRTKLGYHLLAKKFNYNTEGLLWDDAWFFNNTPINMGYEFQLKCKIIYHTISNAYFKRFI